MPFLFSQAGAFCVGLPAWLERKPSTRTRPRPLRILRPLLGRVTLLDLSAASDLQSMHHVCHTVTHSAHFSARAHSVRISGHFNAKNTLTQSGRPRIQEDMRLPTASARASTLSAGLEACRLVNVQSIERRSLLNNVDRTQVAALEEWLLFRQASLEPPTAAVVIVSALMSAGQLYLQQCCLAGSCAGCGIYSGLRPAASHHFRTVINFVICSSTGPAMSHVRCDDRHNPDPKCTWSLSSIMATNTSKCVQ
jgi:hypothetical protein